MPYGRPWILVDKHLKTHILQKMKFFLSLVIFLTGMALIARTVLLTGSLNMSSGMIAGLAFTAYGAVRLYYARGAS